MSVALGYRAHIEAAPFQICFIQGVQHGDGTPWLIASLIVAMRTPSRSGPISSQCRRFTNSSSPV
jgi:hypothetical protein